MTGYCGSGAARADCLCLRPSLDNGVYPVREGNKSGGTYKLYVCQTHRGLTVLAAVEVSY